MALTFKGGIPVKEIEAACDFSRSLPELCDNLLSGNSPLTAKGFLKVCIPTNGLIPTVKEEDFVLRGQIIADAQNDEECPVFSSVSGKVSSVTVCDGEYFVTVMTDTSEEEVLLSTFDKPLKDASADEITARIRESGIMSGKKPLHQKIKELVGTSALVINCALCDPFPSGEMFEAELDPRAVCGGAKILLKALSIPYAVFAVTENNIHILKPLLNAVSGDKLFRISELKAKYPQQNEALLYCSLSGKELDILNMPSAMPAAIFSLSDCIAVYNAFVCGKPYVDTTVSVYGSAIEKPKVVTVPIGTYIKDIAAYCGAQSGCRIAVGGILASFGAEDDQCVSGAVTALAVNAPTQEEAKENGIDCCIRCGRCTSVCPMRIMPIAIAQYALKEDFKKCKELGAHYCIECESCSFICPQGIDICKAVSASKSYLPEDTVEPVKEDLPETKEETVTQEPSISEEETIETAEEKPDGQKENASTNKSKKGKKGGGKKKK